MKQKDIIVIIIVVFVSGVLSIFVSSFLFGKPSQKQQTAEVVDIISSNFSTPDKKFFNTSSIDPTKLIQIGNSNNPNPFSGSR